MLSNHFNLSIYVKDKRNESVRIAIQKGTVDPTDKQETHNFRMSVDPCKEDEVESPAHSSDEEALKERRQRMLKQLGEGRKTNAKRCREV